jgi:hypothetical protein
MSSAPSACTQWVLLHQRPPCQAGLLSVDLHPVSSPQPAAHPTAPSAGLRAPRLPCHSWAAHYTCSLNPPRLPSSTQRQPHSSFHPAF